MHLRPLPVSLANLLLLIALHQTTKTLALIVYNDGLSHSITKSIDDAVYLRSSSSLLFSGSHAFIRAPRGSESAVRLYMSSLLNMTVGEIIGGDLDDSIGENSQDTIIGAGVVVGSASRAEFYDTATVRGGSHPEEVLMLTRHNLANSFLDVTNFWSGKGGDALVGLYFSSSITTHGGNFIGGRGRSKFGHSLHVAYDAQANIYGGSFHGSFLARDRGVIVVHGCLSRVGNRLVGHLDNGDVIDVQLIEENDGQIIVQAPKYVETCRKYHDRSFGTKLMVRTFAVAYTVGAFVYLLLDYI